MNPPGHPPGVGFPDAPTVPNRVAVPGGPMPNGPIHNGPIHNGPIHNGPAPGGAFPARGAVPLVAGSPHRPATMRMSAPPLHQPPAAGRHLDHPPTLHQPSSLHEPPTVPQPPAAQHSPTLLQPPLHPLPALYEPPHYEQPQYEPPRTLHEPPPAGRPPARRRRSRARDRAPADEWLDDIEPQPELDRDCAPPPDFGRKRNPGRLLGLVAIAVAVVMAGLLGVGSYSFLASINLVSDDPLAASSGWLRMLAVGALGGLAALGLAFIAVTCTRAKLTAAAAMTISLVLPVIAVAIGVTLGFATAKQNLESQLQGDGGVDVAVRVIDAWGVDVPQPLRDLLRFLSGDST